MSKCKYCGIEGEWRQTQYGNRLFIGEEMHKCPNYKKPAIAGQQFKETSGTFVPQGYVQQQQQQQQQPTQIPTPQPEPEPLAITQMQTTLDALLTKLSDMKKVQDNLAERIDFLYRMERANAEGENL